MSTVRIVESSRLAWQALPKVMNAEVQAEYLRSLVAAGFRHLDAVSFVSQEAVPQMAESEYVLEFLDAPENVEIIGLVVNAKGAERAVASGKVSTLAFPYSISPTWLERNLRRTPEEALDQLEQIGEAAYKAGLDVVAYVPMAFGNPFGDVWDIDEVVSAVDLLVDSGVLQVSLGDTTGAAEAGQIGAVLGCVMGVHDGLEVGVTLRTRLGDAEEKIRAAFGAGCRRFASVLGGVGDIALAADPGVRNLPTELLLDTLRELGATLPEIEPLDRLILSSREIERRYGSPVQ